MERLLRSFALTSLVGLTALAAVGCEQLIGLDKFHDVLCAAGSTRSCYGGPAGTEGVGNCKPGTQTCADDGQSWGPCTGDVQPEPAEDCSKPGDENCDGKVCSDVIWAKLYGDGVAALNAMALDGEGNLFLGGVFKGTLTFGTTKLMALGTNGDAFLAKLGPDGSPKWAKSFGATGSSTYLHAIGVDASGRVSAAGSSTNGADFGCGAPAPAGAVVLQYDAAGGCLWSHTVAAAPTGSLNVRALAVDPMTQDLVVAGSFSGDVDLGTGTLQTLDPLSDYDIFMIRLRGGPVGMGGGALAWAQAYGGKAPGGRRPVGIAIDKQGAIHLLGTLQGDLSNGSDAVSSSSPTATDVLYAILSSTGAPSGAWSYGAGTDQGPAAIALDPTGKRLITGYLTGTVSFGNGPLMTSGASDKNTFLVKFGQESVPVYSKMWGDGSIDGATGVASDADANIILSGGMLGTINFGGADLSNGGNSAAYLVKLTPSAKHVWSKAFGDETTALAGDALCAVDPKTQDVLLGVSFAGNVDFGNGKLSANGQGFAVAKFNP